MKKMKFNFGSDKMLSKDQMKTITGGYMHTFMCYCQFSSDFGGIFGLNCEQALGSFVYQYQCPGSWARCEEIFNESYACSN